MGSIMPTQKKKCLGCEGDTKEDDSKQNEKMYMIQKYIVKVQLITQILNN